MNLGGTYQVLAQRGVAPDENLRRSGEALTEAARLRKKQESWGEYAGAQFSLGVTKELQARRGTDRKATLESARQAYEEALRCFSLVGVNTWIAETKKRLKAVLEALKELGLDS